MPFLILGLRYDALPEKLPLLRGSAALADKSWFTVFRIPLMNLAHALAAAMLLRHRTDFAAGPRRDAYAAIFTSLFLAASVKSIAEALEFSRLWPRAAAMTFASVALGLVAAAVLGRRASLPWRELSFAPTEKLLLAALATTYLALLAGTARLL